MSSDKNLTERFYRALKKRSETENMPGIVILESQLDDHPESKDTYIAALPEKKISLFSDKTGDNTWNLLGDLIRDDNGWLFGYLGYDLKNSVFDRLTSENRVLIDTPDLFMFSPSVLIRIRDDEAVFLKGEPFEPPVPSYANEFEIKGLKPLITQQEFKKNVERIQHQIKEGDFYEINYTYPITAQLSGDTFSLFRKMSDVNPVPFAAYIEFDDTAVCSVSPERFLKKSGNTIMSEPIKGTSGRSGLPEEDEQLKSQLMNEKNRAENLMIVDLVRHDFAQVCETGSVKVSKLYEIQSFDTVHQLISRVEGRLSEKYKSVDALRACFPMGSMTGAPKYRVLKEIEKYEIYKRGVYSGAIGYITPDDDFDFNVVIRSAIVKNNKLVFPVGGAITSDSDPDDEWRETEIKSRALTDAAKM